MKIKFESQNLSDKAEIEINFAESYLIIDEKDANVWWYQVLKGQHPAEGELVLLLDNGVLII